MYNAFLLKENILYTIVISFDFFHDFFFLDNVSLW